jgi:hypothetical protein
MSKELTDVEKIAKLRSSLATKAAQLIKNNITLMISRGVL